ncbi:MAG: DUF4265 domain-containing protein, partial [Pseudohongiella sp.]
ILDPSFAAIVWVHFAPPISDMFRKSYRKLLRWNDDYPFAKFGLAADDRIRYPVENAATYDLLEHSGNLSIRVFSKHNTEELDQALTPEIELIDGRIDISSPGLLVYTIHVSIGFQKIEDVLQKTLARFPDTLWFYGNVYDPADGVTPLNWWQDIAQSV